MLEAHHLDQAYQWLCKKRKAYHANNDVWHLRFKWAEVRQTLLHQLQNGTLTFDAVQKIKTPRRSTLLFPAQDALVLKAMTLVLTESPKPVLSTRIYHLAAEAGASKKGSKAAIQAVMQALPNNQFFLRTDVKSYYASIDHEVLLGHLKPYVLDPGIWRLLRLFLRGTVRDEGGVYHTIRKGIALGCPLSPLLGALMLKPLDDAMEDMGLFYARYMDDWVVLAPTRWKLRQAIAQVNQSLAALNLQKHPDKTEMGRIDKGFTFLGFALSRHGVRPSEQSIENCRRHIQRMLQKNLPCKNYSIRVGLCGFMSKICSSGLQRIIHTGCGGRLGHERG